MSLKKSTKALERRRKRDEAEARAADKRTKAAAFNAQAAEAARIAESIAAALEIVAAPDWKQSPIGKATAEERKARAQAFRAIADDCEKANRKSLGQTVRFIASEIELGVGLGPYVNQEG